jgi:rhamnosyltransferase
MATYNGDKFLEEQLLSILNQKGVEFKIIIRDDLSSDNTKNIINKYTKDYPNIIHALENKNLNIGISGNFRELLKNIDADYYFFCDQDDIWHDKKLLLTLKELMHIQKDGVPCAIFSDAVVINSNNDIIHHSFWAYQKIIPQIVFNWKKLLVQNVVMGCTLGFNKIARDLYLENYSDAFYHDHLLAILVSKYGTIGYIKQPLLKYRQHNMNVLGAVGITPKYLYSKIYNVKYLFPKYIRQIKIFPEMNIFYFILYKVAINIKRLFYKN